MVHCSDSVSSLCLSSCESITVTENDEQNSNFNLLDIQVKTDHISALKGKVIVAWKTKETVKSDVKKHLKFAIVGSELFETNEPNQYRLVLQKRTTEEKEKYELIVEPYFTEDAIRDSKNVHEEMVKNMREIDEYKEKMGQAPP